MSVFQKLIFRGLVRMDIILFILGTLIGWGITHAYYVRSLNDLKADAKERMRVYSLLLRGIESIGTIKYSRDASGKETGVVIELYGSAKASATATGELTVGSPTNAN